MVKKRLGAPCYIGMLTGLEKRVALPACEK
jgi:hypothetical protein